MPPKNSVVLACFSISARVHRWSTHHHVEFWEDPWLCCNHEWFDLLDLPRAFCPPITFLPFEGLVSVWLCPFLSSFSDFTMSCWGIQVDRVCPFSLLTVLRVQRLSCGPFIFVQNTLFHSHRLFFHDRQPESRLRRWRLMEGRRPRSASLELRPRLSTGRWTRPS